MFQHVNHRSGNSWPSHEHRDAGRVATGEATGVGGHGLTWTLGDEPKVSRLWNLKRLDMNGFPVHFLCMPLGFKLCRGSVQNSKSIGQIEGFDGLKDLNTFESERSSPLCDLLCVDHLRVSFWFCQLTPMLQIYTKAKEADGARLIPFFLNIIWRWVDWWVEQMFHIVSLCHWEGADFLQRPWADNQRECLEAQSTGDHMGTTWGPHKDQHKPDGFILDL
jgi:hypothetical protein